MQTLPAPRILVVDDDPALRDLLSEYLGANGFTVDVAGDGPAMEAAMAVHVPDAVVLDLMLPGEDGLTLARRLRSHSELPILMLSARGEEIDRVVGLEVGADDYLAKPFSPRELLARLRALLRRARPTAGADLPAAPGHPSFGPYLLDLAAHRLLRNGAEIRLTTAEFDLLRLFVERPNRVLNRDDIIDRLKGYTRDAFDRSVDIRVARLRRKIEADPANPDYIRTVRGEGYLFNPLGPQVAP
ncbi:MAG: response regulator [Rhodocyclaceae bacterium]|jgi:two-component system phosphate regulon response regulator OmpR|nr:response regulator [Rhodocyclaceae bacterium]